MKALCDGIGVPCYYVHANSRASNPSHQWNFVKVGGKWYVLDAQSGVFLVSGKTFQNSFGMRWNTKGLSFRQQDRPPEGRIRRQCDGGIKCRLKISIFRRDVCFYVSSAV